VRTVGVKLMADVSGYVSGLQRAKTATADFKGQLDNAAKKGNLDAVADRATGVGLALVGMAGYAIKSAADFDKAMSSVSAATHASSGDIEKLRQAALQAGKDTSFSATEAADGITELSKAGVSTADVLGGGLKGALSLAAAGQLSVGEAAETAASAMTQFKLKGDQVPHVADLLAAAAGKAQGSVHDMGYALSQSGLVASQFGLSIEDTTGVLAEFASAGLIGSDAGTSLKTMLIAIANPSKVTAALMQNLGISFYDAQGKFVGLSGVADVLRDKLSSLTDQERQQALAQIFGNDALRAASVLYADGSKKVEEWKGKVNDAGYAARPPNCRPTTWPVTSSGSRARWRPLPSRPAPAERRPTRADQGPQRRRRPVRQPAPGSWFGRHDPGRPRRWHVARPRRLGQAAQGHRRRI
jgi:TP901 family phage tail tape measure protein